MPCVERWLASDGGAVTGGVGVVDCADTATAVIERARERTNSFIIDRLQRRDLLGFCGGRAPQGRDAGRKQRTHTHRRRSSGDRGVELGGCLGNMPPIPDGSLRRTAASNRLGIEPRRRGFLKYRKGCARHNLPRWPASAASIPWRPLATAHLDSTRTPV